MKDGTTHLAYKAEHVVDLDSGIILGAEIIPADVSDTHSLEDSLHKAQIHLEAAQCDKQIRDVAADKGYHSTDTLNELSEHTDFRTYIPEPKTGGGRNWSKRSSKERKAVLSNRRRAKGKRVASCNGCEVSMWKGHSPMCLKPAEVGAAGYAGPTRFRRGTFY